jgi:UV excision repair protein RAD23
MLEPILQQVGAGNPQLAQLIGQNRDQFLQLLSEDVDDDAPLPPGAQEISVTEGEREAIDRVCLCLNNSRPTIRTLLTFRCSCVVWDSTGI